MKSKRQERILELIQKHEIETQDDMMNRLREEGFTVTQATVSRDLKELKLTKTLTSRGTYRYSQPSRHHIASNAKLSRAMVDSITHVDYSLNTVVLKTYPGMAQAIASGVDSLQHKTILGCVAGDDTIIVVTETEAGAEELCWQLRELMKGH